MTFKTKMNIAPLVSAGGLLAITKGYCTVNERDVDLSVHVQTAGVLGAAHLIAQHGTPEVLPRAVSTGVLFTAGMYAMGNSNVVRLLVLGTVLGYVAETISGGEVNEAQEESVDESGGPGGYNRVQ